LIRWNIKFKNDYELCCFVGLLAWLIKVSGLAKVAIFTTNLDAVNQTMINCK
jgi:hypothetical protein